MPFLLYDLIRASGIWDRIDTVTLQVRACASEVRGSLTNASEAAEWGINFAEDRYNTLCDYIDPWRPVMAVGAVWRFCSGDNEVDSACRPALRPRCAGSQAPDPGGGTRMLGKLQRDAGGVSAQSRSAGAAHPLSEGPGGRPALR